MYKRIQKSKRRVNKLFKRKSIKKQQIKKRKTNKKQSKKRKSTKKQVKRTRKFRKNKKQYGGDFNSEEIEELKAILRDRNLFTEDEISQIIKKINLSAQRFAGPHFEQIKDHFINGQFRDKEDFMNWIDEAHGELEEKVETDTEYADYDSEDGHEEFDDDEDFDNENAR
jgi:hypothetical protein